MTRQGAQMAGDERPGEAAERASRRRWLRLFGLSLAAGGISGLAVSLSLLDGGGTMGDTLPPAVAIALAALWLALMIYGAWYYETQVDELERNANYYGYAVGGGLVLVLYPVWSLLWWARLVPEPMHEVLMGLLLAGALAGYLWKKYR
jgi:hypothetical protein